MPVFTTGETIALNTDRSAVAIPTIAVSADLSIPVYTLKVSAEVSDGAESYWSADLINWTKFSNHVEFSANGVYYFKAVDAENFLESYTQLSRSAILTELLRQNRLQVQISPTLPTKMSR